MKLLKDEECEKIKNLLLGKKGDAGRSASDNRLFIEGVLYIIKTGIHGDIYQKNMISGIAFGKDLIDGVIKEYGIKYLKELNLN